MNSHISSHQNYLTYFHDSQLGTVDCTPTQNRSCNQATEMSALLSSDHRENRDSTIVPDSYFQSIRRFWINRQATACLKSGKKFHKQLKFEEALEEYQKSLNLYQKCEFDKVKMGELYYNIGRLNKEQKKTNEAFSLFQDSLKILEQCDPNSMLVADVYCEIGSLYELENRSTAAMEHYEVSASIYDDRLPERHSCCTFTSYPSTESAIYVYCKIGEKKRRLGQINEALNCFQKCVNLLRRYPYSLILSDIYYIMAKIHRTHDNMSEAINFYKKSYCIFQSLIPIKRLGQTNYTFHNPQINQATEVLLSEHQANSAKGTTHFLEGIERISKLYQATRIFKAGFALHDDRNDEALQKYEECLQIFEQYSPLGISVANVCNNIGLLHLSKKDLPTALHFFERAFKLQNRLVPISYDIADTYFNMATIYGAQQNLKEYRKNIDQSTKIRELCEKYGSC